MQNTTTKARSTTRPAASLRRVDLDVMLRFGTEINPGVHILTGATARREAKRLRRELDALERLGRQAVPVQF